MKILAVDSSAKSCSAAVVEDKKILGRFFINTALTHSQTLAPMIDAVLKSVGENPETIDAFAVSVGPGSFTGVRIGVATVKGIAMPLNKPCIAVSTLEAMPYNLMSEDCIAVAVMDARCNQVYNALFEIKGGIVSRICDDRAISIDDLADELKNYNGKLILVGDGAELCYNSYKEIFDNIHLAPDNNRYQNAVGVALSAFDKNTMTAEELLPTYLRLPQAQRELKKRMESKK
ncbi:MAG: tRNA (adenosine(37)-N6)-threonylcarbamoyltransferase complex dimerization subunit type 1 TsaB [Ruminococcus sp.]|nr:tRNA (adenosine(37)-N6)-threonylcarbamoyltransferase complex dimerization subunit type 1 TsaB [Ruminococcus sp.]